MPEINMTSGDNALAKLTGFRDVLMTRLSLDSKLTGKFS